MAAKHTKKIANERMSGKESTDDSDEEDGSNDGSDDGSHAEDWDRSSSADVTDEDDKLRSEQKPITRAKARPCTSDVQKTRQVQETDIEPGMQKAVDTVVKKGVSMMAAAKQHNIKYESLRLAIIKTGYRPRGQAATKTQIDAAIEDIVERGVSINRATKLHRVHHTTLTRILNLKELKPVHGSCRVPNPQVQKAIDAAVKKGMSRKSAGKLYRIDVGKTSRLNIVKAGFKPPRRQNASKDQIDAAIKDIMERFMTIMAASKLHRVDRGTLREALRDRNLTKPINPGKTRKEMAVRAVLNQNQSAQAVAKRYGVEPSTVQKELRRRGYVFEGSSLKGTWVKVQPAPASPVGPSSVRQPNSPIDGNQADTEKEWTDAEEDEEEDEEEGEEEDEETTSHEKEIEDPEPTDCPPHASADSKEAVFAKRRSFQEYSDNGRVEEHGKNVEGKLREDAGGQGKGGVNTRDELPDQEIERIVDVRTQRQYLVKWQGEEEATWVDEDIFLGLTNLAIK